MSDEFEDLPDSIPLNGDVVDVEEQAYDPAIPLYEHAFPLLESSHSPYDQPQQGSQARLLRIAPFKSTIKTEAFQIPLEERRFTPEVDSHQQQQQAAAANSPHSHGNWESKTRNSCTEVARKCRVAVEFNATKRGALNVFVTGREANVLEAKRMLLRQLQTQCMIQLSIPKEHHKALLGQKGAHIQEMELLTSSKIKFPNADEPNNTVIITGTKEGAEHARQLLQSRSDELAKLGFERLPIAKRFHQLVCHRTNNPALHTLVEKGMVRLVIPPLNVMRDEIVVSGEKEAVKAAVQLIQMKLKLMENDCQELSIELSKEKHKYIIGAKGSGIAEILEETGVLVSLPPVESDSQSVNFFGPSKQLGEALTRVFAKSASVKLVHIPAPAWLHRFIIGRKGAALEPLMKGRENTHISFDGATDEIRLEGPPDEVDELEKQVRDVVTDLQSRLSFEVLNVEPSLHKHIVGKEGSNLRKLRAATGVSISLPSESQGRTVRIEGSPEGVAKAKADIMQMLQKIENTKTKDMIIDHKLIPRLIGQHGKTIREFREKYPAVIVNFPKPDTDSNIVVLRGPRDEVDNAAKALKKLYQDIVEANYSEEVYVPKTFHRNIIGKDGATIREIREATSCKIALPDPNDTSELIVVTGTKKDVTKAVNMIQDIYRVQSNVVELSLEVPIHLHTRLIGKQGQNVLELQQEFDNKVQIRFPGYQSLSTIVMIRGPKQEANAARDRLAKMVTELADKYHQDDVRVPASHHRFIIGVKGVNMQRIRDATGVRILFPDTGIPAQSPEGEAPEPPIHTPFHQDTDAIRILGSKVDVEKAKVMLLEIVNKLGEIVSEIVHVDSKWRSHFNRRRGDELARLSNLCCVRMELATKNAAGATGRPPPTEATAPSSTFAVRIEGPKDNVDMAKEKLQHTLYTLEHSVTEEMWISLKHKQSLLGACRRQVEKLALSHNVNIHVSDEPVYEGGGCSPDEPNSILTNGDSAIHSDGSISNAGRNSGMANSDKENLSPVKHHLLHNGDDHSSAVSEASSTEIQVASPKLKKPIAKAKDTFPSPPTREEATSLPDTESDPQFKVTLAGLREDVAKVRSGLMDLCPVEKEIPVECEFHSAIIGAGGKKVQELREKHSVNVIIPIPKRKHPFITLIGLKDSVSAALMEIEDFVERLKLERDDRIARNYSTVARVAPNFHSFVIGSKGSNIAHLRERYGVFIIVPQAKDQSDEIIIRGYKDKADAACKEILQMVAKLESYVTATLSIPPRVHPLLIGARGANLSRIRQEYDVEIAFPSRTALPGVEAETVTITGVQDKVDQCSDYLINRANELLMELEERDQRNQRPPPSGYLPMNVNISSRRAPIAPAPSAAAPPPPPPPPPTSISNKTSGTSRADTTTAAPPPPPPPPPPSASSSSQKGVAVTPQPTMMMNGNVSWSQKVVQKPKPPPPTAVPARK